MKQSFQQNISQQLTQGLSQQLRLTPQLKQSLKLLQLASQDLEQEIQTALDTNPLLERVDTELSGDGGAGDIPIIAQAQDNGNPQPVSEAADPTYEMDRTDNLSPEQDLAVNYQESFESHHHLNQTSPSDSKTEFTHYVTKQETLFEHLDWQIQMTSLSDKDKLIARSLIRSIDDEGYLAVDLSEICAMFDQQMMVDEDEVHAVLSLIKTLEPIGVGARNLSERLLIMLDQHAENTVGLDIAKAIVQHHVDLLATRNFALLKKELGITDTALSHGMRLITQLNPRITARFQSDNENYVIPDVIVKKQADGWRASINPDNEARLRVNQTYSDLLNSKLDDDGSEFIQTNLNQAKLFIKSLMSRYDTLLLVSQAIVERQSAFFENGEQYMQPMVLNDIAEQLEMHESTISRATSGKYLLSSRGVFELKYFFSSALSTTSGAASSSTAIRSLIKKMVESESKKKPLSDSKIAQELEEQGHIVARRTVAKYRESMQIAPSSQRKALN